MTNWRAVFIGFLAELVFNLLGVFVGIISPGLLAGLVAGYLAGISNSGRGPTATRSSTSIR